MKKIVLAILTVLLMIGISVVVANIVHRSGESGDGSSKVENGLSAYELAVQYGYDGSMQDWLVSLSGKSAYEIAVDNGYTGTEDEWASALAASAKQENKDIKTASFSESGELLITLSDNTVLNLGKAVGADGKNGADGKDGITPQIRVNSETNEWEISTDDDKKFRKFVDKAEEKDFTVYRMIKL